MPRKQRAGPPDPEIGERLRGDPIFAMAQVAVLVKIMLTVLLLDPRSLDTFTLPKSVAAHAASLFIAALLIWLFARHGRAILFWSPVHIGVGAVLLAFALATPFALDPTVALFGTFKRYLGLTQMLDDALLYLSVATLFRDTRSLRLLTTVGAGVAVPVLAYALIQRLELDPLRFTQGSTRAPISTLGNPDIAAGFVAVIGVSALGVVLLRTGRALAWTRLALLALGVASVGILYTTGVRAGVLAVAGGWLTTVLLATRMPQVGARRVLGAVALAALFAAGVVLSPVGARLAPEYLRSDTAVLSRVDIWRAAAMSVIERPLFGVGPDNFAAAYPSRRTEGSIHTGELQTSTHDFWLYAATSAGIAGLACLLLLLALAVDGALRLARQGRAAGFALLPMIAYLSQALVNVNDISVDWIFWTAIGVIAGASGAPVGQQARRQAPHRSANAVGALALGVAALVALVGIWPRVSAGEAMQGAEAYAAAGASEVAIPYAQDAVRADSRRAEYWSSYGATLHNAGNGPASVQAFSMAADRQPWHPQTWKNLAIAWSSMGNGIAAYEAAKRIPETDPYDGEGRELLAQTAYDRGDYARAATEGELAIAYQDVLSSARESAYFTTISAYVQLKALERAERLAREGTARFATLRMRLQLAAIIADRGNTAEALSMAEAVVREFPENAAARGLRDALLKR